MLSASERSPLEVRYSMIGKRIFAVVTLLLLVLAIVLVKNKNVKQKEFTTLDTQIKEGDLIFQTSLSSQSKAIQLATNSPYSHCGIIYKNEGRFFVFEANQPVELTPLNDWVKRGKDGKFVVKRLKNANEIINAASIEGMKKEGQSMLGRTYDLTFEWSDGQLYCSELIWKIYKRALNIELAKLEKLGTFDLTHPIVKEVVSKRYGKNPPLEEPVISPKAIFDSQLLITVKSNL